MARDAELARRLGVVGVPAFFVNGRYLGGAKSFEDFDNVVGQELGRATARVVAGVPATRIYEDIVKTGKASVK